MSAVRRRLHHVANVACGVAWVIGVTLAGDAARHVNRKAAPPVRRTF